MMEALVAADAIVNPIYPGRGSPSADIDFFLRPPPWIGGRGKKRIAYFYWEAIPLPRPSSLTDTPNSAVGCFPFNSG